MDKCDGDKCDVSDGVKKHKKKLAELYKMKYL